MPRPVRPLLHWGLGSMALMLASCGKDAESLIGDPQSTPMPQPGGISFELGKEVEALQGALALPSVLVFPAVLAVGFILTRLLAYGTRLAIRVGVRRRRLLSTVSAVATICVWLWAGSVVVGRLLRTAPAITLITVGLLTVVLLVGMSKAVENVVAGMVLTLRRRVEEGDQVTVGDFKGMVERVGFTRVVLRTEAGDTVDVPTRQFVSEAVMVGRARHSFPLEVVLKRERPWGADELERARRTATLSPYGDSKSRVRVQTRGDDGRTLVVGLQVWSHRILPEAERHLRQQLAAHLGG